MIDLRSDTVTRPTAAMRAAMAAAEVGDDVFGEDPTVNAFEAKVAALFGHEAALFCSSGTQTNQIAINVHTRPGDAVLCEEGAHVYRYEGGGMMANSGCSVKFLPHERGRFTAEAVEAAIDPLDNPHLPRTRLVTVENTSNRGGGAVWNIEEVGRIRKVCDRHGLALHLDGARIFNAMTVDGTKAEQWGALFHSISICFSKGLGAPIGSVLTGSKEFIFHARRTRKRWGGGMRQAGTIAAGTMHALENHVQRLSEDHARATRLGAAVAALTWVERMLPVETNIVVLILRDGSKVNAVLDALKARGVLAVAFGPGAIRFVTHLDIDDDAIDRAIAALNAIQI